MMRAARQELMTWIGAGLALAALLPWTPATAAEGNLDVDAVRSALVLNFTRYTAWPEADAGEAASDTLFVGVLGDDDLFAALSSIDCRMSGSRVLRVKRMLTPAQAADLDAVFLAGSDRDVWQSVRVAVGDRPVLTISEMNGFLDAGGMINLVMNDGRFRFEVNLAGARDVGLKISSRLLKLARKVKE